MEKSIRMEMEAGLSKVWLHVYTEEEYEEDYQMPMLKANRIAGVLPVEGCEVEGTGRYSYDVSGLTSLKALYEKKKIKKKDIEEIVSDLLKTIEALRQYMLTPDCLLLQPEYIFRGDHGCYFCYLPGFHGELSTAFHELSEYFVKMLDYEDTEGIFLAYELHKATLQEHYDLSGIMKEYARHEKERREEQKESDRKDRDRKDRDRKDRQTEENYGNIFSLTEEEEHEETEKYERQFNNSKKYEVHVAADSVREESGLRPAWRKAIRRFPGKRWGQWGDLILETDRQEEKSTL